MTRVVGVTGDVSRLALDDVYLAVALEGEDRRAWDHFHREYFGLIRRVAGRVALNQDDAEDVAQEVCATIHRRIAKYEGRASLKGWLYSIVPNITRDRYRSGDEKWTGSLDARTAGDDDDRPASDSSLLTDAGKGADDVRGALEQSRCREMFAKTLARALESLDPPERELVVYKFLKGLKSREIARIRGVKEYVISKHLKKALGRLEKRILMSATTLFGFSKRDVRDCLQAVA